MKLNVDYQEQFENRHISPNEQDTQAMLQTIGVNSVDELIAQTVPANIRLKGLMDLPKAKSEFAYLKDLKPLQVKKNV